jgi:glycosyltransferase involved in cell wall biosynthesis
VRLEVLGADGGSTDATTALAAAAGARVIDAPRGRGAQMNAAARLARAPMLLFLHADSRLPDPHLLAGALRALETAGREGVPVAGHFPLCFDRRTDRNRLGYCYLEEKSGLNREQTINGDQGLLLAAPFFARLGGFDERLPFLEDQRIAARIRSCGRWLTLPGRLHTSARRFETEGFHRRYLLMGLIMVMHSLGCEKFFARAPGVYRVQRQTGRLLLTPYFRLLRSLARQDLGLRTTGTTLLRLGGYLRANLWQLFFFCDVLLRPLFGPGRYPLLGLHDRLRAWLPARGRVVWLPLDALLGLGGALFVLGVLAPWFRLVDGRADGDQP